MLADLEEWLHAQERKLKEVEANPNESSEDSLMERYEKLQVSISNRYTIFILGLFFYQFLFLTKILQAEMESKMHDIAELQTTLQNISDECSREAGQKPKQNISSDSDVVIPEDSNNKLMEKIELLQDRWDALSQIVEAQSQRVLFYKLFAKIVLACYFFNTDL